MRQAAVAQHKRAPSDVFAGGGEMGERMRSHDWQGTSLGDPAAWPQSLKTAINIMLTSRYAMWMAYGRDLTFFCNDAYEPTLGVKSPWALGAPAPQVWAEIWGDIGPRIEHVLENGVATWDQGLLLFLERSGFPEETYHTFSYSPLRTDSGAIGGMLCVVAEETERVIGERRLTILGDLAARLSTAKSETDVADALRRSLGDDGQDLPFTLTYLFEADGHTARLVCTTGLAPDHPAAPATIAADAVHPWPVAALRNNRSPVHVTDLTPLGALPTGGWRQPPRQALLLPIAQQGQDSAAGFLVAAVNPFRPLDAAYDGFMALVVGQIAASFANVHAYAEERHRAEVLAELNRAKTTFFSNISHEFRTPLTLMLGPLEELLSGSSTLAPDVRDRVDTAHRNGLRLLKLVNALLDFSRLEAGRMAATFRPTDLALLTADLAASFRSAMQNAGLNYEVETPPLPAPVYIDRDLWEKIVLNLLSNAFKFTMQGGVRLALMPSADATRVLLTVSDTGAGIPEAELPRLFERFHRVEGTRGRSFEGSGIGLALVQELVKLHGGTIDVRSKVGRGTTFTVTLAFGTAHLPSDRVNTAEGRERDLQTVNAYADEALHWPTTAGTAPSVPVAAVPRQGNTDGAEIGQGGRLVLADDNADMRDYVRRLLIARGYDVEAVGDGLAALQAIRRDPPDLVLSDVMMPGMDGFGLLAAIRADETLRGIPVLLLSARAGEEARVEGVSAGANDYLTKPFSAHELVARVAANMSLARARREAMQTLHSLNRTLEDRVAERTRERDRVWRLSTELMVAASLDSTALATNPAWRQTLGWEKDELIGRRLSDLVHPEDAATTLQTLQALGRGERSQQVAIRLRRRDGNFRTIEWNAVLEDGIVYGVGRDVTDARAVAERLRQAQKMETIGYLTGGVAHDFNNLLTVIIGNIEMIRRSLDDLGDATSQRLRRAGDQAMRGAERAASLTQRLLAFSRRQPLDPKPIDVNRLILGMSDLLNRTLGDHISIDTMADPQLWRTHADPNELENALLNLAVNARDAMPNGGKLTIETSNALLDERYASQFGDVNPGQYVQIAVTDTGFGMSKASLSQAFEPFFTTKDVGHGTGLGLSQVYGFVKQSGGHVKIYSEEGHGTTVKVYLPRMVAEEMVEEPVMPDPKAPKSDAGELLLVVEDDDDVRSYSVQALRELGYRTLEAADGPAALRLLEHEPDVRMLFTDVGLPGGLNGRELADAARALRPHLLVLFTTGYARNAIVHGGRLDPGVNLITKPFTFEDLAAKVRGVLDAAAPAPRILVVEDEPLVSMMAVEALTDAGFLVDEAATSAEAVAKVAAATQSFDAVILDMGLPDRPGDEVARQLRAMRADLPIVIASGYDRGRLQHLFAGDARIAVVAKPYVSNDLRRALGSLGITGRDDAHL